jgi:hypothetical protein
MKLMQALELINKPPNSTGGVGIFLLACGFSPLHLRTFFQAHLQVQFPKKKAEVMVDLGIFHLQGAQPTKDRQCVFHDRISELYRIKLGGFPPGRKGFKGQHVHGVAIHVFCCGKGLSSI